jgi:hypothetical protein
LHLIRCSTGVCPCILQNAFQPNGAIRNQSINQEEKIIARIIIRFVCSSAQCTIQEKTRHVGQVLTYTCKRNLQRESSHPSSAEANPKISSALIPSPTKRRTAYNLSHLSASSPDESCAAASASASARMVLTCISSAAT